jgi:hypothetical protein
LTFAAALGFVRSTFARGAGTLRFAGALKFVRWSADRLAVRGLAAVFGPA